MKTQPMNHDNGLSENQLVEEYFTAISERQRLEEEYYQTRDPELLVKIKTAKERIREVEETMGIKKKSIPSGGYSVLIDPSYTHQIDPPKLTALF